MSDSPRESVPAEAAPAPDETPAQVAAAPTASATTRRISRRWPLISGFAAVMLAAALGALIAGRNGNLPFEFDEEWMEEVLEHRTIWWDVPSLFMNWLGGGIVGVVIIPVGTVLLLCLFRRFWAALYYGAAAAASALVVQLLKGLYDRPRPEDILVTSDVGSFPSGHTANAATIAVTLGIIFPRVWVWVTGALYSVAMLLSRTYLGAHWISDTIGGLLVGAGVAIILWAPFAAKLEHERHRLDGVRVFGTPR